VVLSALMMLRRLAAALRVALREEDFARILSAGLLLIVIGTLTFTSAPTGASSTASTSPWRP
jgi:hypothetical protein